MTLLRLLRHSLYFFSIAISLFSFSTFANTNIALKKPAYVSSFAGTNYEGKQATDGKSTTRWTSNHSDNNWISIDLGIAHQITGVKLQWEGAYGKSYHIQTSADGNIWTTIFSTSTGDGGIDNLTLAGIGRYVRMAGVKRGTQWGYSLWEFEVYGSVVNAVAMMSSLATTTDTTTNIARSKSVTASTIAGSSYTPAMATDGNVSTRWASSNADSNWIAIDLGAAHTITGAKLQWEGAYGKSYHIQTSADANNWTTVFSTNTGDGGIDNLTFTGTGRYIRMLGVQRGTQWGYSLWEFEVYGAPVNVIATNIARNKTVTASTLAGSGYVPALVVDGSITTRWASSNADNNWISIDLGSLHTITAVKLIWEGAYGKSYKIQTSTDGVNWTVIYSTTAGDGGTDNIIASGLGRYVRMLGVQRGTEWGYSLWEFEVHGYIATGGTNLSSSSNVGNSSSSKNSSSNPSTSSKSSATSSSNGQASSGSTIYAGSLTLEWYIPTERQSGAYLNLADIGGYEIRYKKSTDTRYTVILINDSSVDRYPLGYLAGSYEFEIATFDKNGNYSDYVKVQPH